MTSSTKPFLKHTRYKTEAAEQGTKHQHKNEGCYRATTSTHQFVGSIDNGVTLPLREVACSMGDKTVDATSGSTCVMSSLSCKHDANSDNSIKMSSARGSKNVCLAVVSDKHRRCLNVTTSP